MRNVRLAGKPWQRPSNEAFIGLVHRYVGKGTDLAVYNQTDLDAISPHQHDAPEDPQLALSCRLLRSRGRCVDRLNSPWIPRPWYPKKVTPSFLDALAALRRRLWSERIMPMSSSGPLSPKTVEGMLDALSRAG